VEKYSTLWPTTAIFFRNNNTYNCELEFEFEFAANLPGRMSPPPERDLSLPSPLLPASPVHTNGGGSIRAARQRNLFAPLAGATGCSAASRGTVPLNLNGYNGKEVVQKLYKQRLH
jgi:hypothetical protein